MDRDVTVVVETMAGSHVPPTEDGNETCFLVRFEGYDLGEDDQPDRTVRVATGIVLSLEGIASLIANLSANATAAGLGTQLRDLVQAEIFRGRAN